MKNYSSKLLGVMAFLGTVSILTAAVAPDFAAAPHERKEVAGLAIVFGAEPEPALTDEMQFLVWRMSDLETEEVYTELSHAEVTISYQGEDYGPFELRPVRGNPGQYQTRHIFTDPGEYATLLQFKKGEESEIHSVDFNFRIADRADLEIPKRRGSR